MRHAGATEHRPCRQCTRAARLPKNEVFTVSPGQSWRPARVPCGGRYTSRGLNIICLNSDFADPQILHECTLQLAVDTPRHCSLGAAGAVNQPAWTRWLKWGLEQLILNSWRSTVLHGPLYVDARIRFAPPRPLRPPRDRHVHSPHRGGAPGPDALPSTPSKTCPLLFELRAHIEMFGG